MGQVSKDTTSAVVDGIIKFIAAGGFITTALIAPNAVQICDKPFAKLILKLDDRSRERELRRIAHYMKRQGLITYQARDYEHGIQLTKAGQKRFKRLAINELAIDLPKVWDKKWRLVFYDIPETEKYQRNFLTSQLRQLGFQQLQKSIWIHPFPCRGEMEVLTEYIKVRKYVSYVEISHIDSEAELKVRFTKILKRKA